MKIKKYLGTGFLVAVMALTATGLASSAEAYGGNAGWGQSQNQIRNLNQIRIQDMSQEHRQLMVQLLTQLRERLMQMLAQIEDSSDSELVMVTRSATYVSDDDALLRGRINDFNRSDYADVWFEYDTDRSNLDMKTNTERIDEDEDEDFSHRVTNLKDDTTYYFRAVGKDGDGERDYGAILRFRTDESSDDEDHPDVTTQSASDIRDNQADLRGYVDMNDFRNGEVFFVYGEDENQIEDVEDDYDSYTGIDEDGDDLQKVRVDTNLDSSDSYREEVDSLEDDTKHYFSICVGYEDEDNDEVLRCGDVRSFVTD